MCAGLLGQIVTPAAGNRVVGVDWIADNSVFGGKYPGDDAYLAWLESRPHRELCRFAVAPDVVADHEATLHRALPMLERIRQLVPVAFVAQNGSTPSWVPWPEFDALFIGGTTEWKLGPDARLMVEAGKRQGKWVHMGRVNSQRRYDYAKTIGCDSVDGTYLAFGPDENLRRVLRWIEGALTDPSTVNYAAPVRTSIREGDSMATTEEVRLALEAKAAQRGRVLDAAALAPNASASLAEHVAAAMMALVAEWRNEAAGLEHSTKRGAAARRKLLHEAASELAGFAGGLVQHAPPEPRAPQPELPISTTEAPVAQTRPPTDYTDYLTGATNVLPTIDPTPVTPPLSFVVPQVIAPPALQPPRLDWDQFVAAVANLKTPDHGSFSTINDLADCGMKFAFSHMARDGALRPETPAWWNVGGTAFHSAVEVIERTMMTSTVGMPNFAAEAAWLAHFDKAIADAEQEGQCGQARFTSADKGKENYDWWRVSGPVMLQKYFDYWAPRRAEGWRILAMPDGRPALELELSLDVNGWPIKVIIDQVWVRPDGSLFIDDLKAGKSAPSSTFQLGVYAHALARELSVDKGWVSQAELMQGALPIAGAFYKAREGSHDKETADLIARHPAAELIARAGAARQIIESRAYLPRVSDWGGGCSSCAHKALCPARGGDDG